MPSFSGVTCILFRFRLYTFIEAAALRSIVLRYTGAPTATHLSSFFPFVSLEMLLYPSIFCNIAVFSLYREYVVGFFLLDGVFLPCDHGLDFFTSTYYVRIQSIIIIKTLPSCL